MQEYKYYIAGEFKESKDKIKVIDPATEEVFANIHEASGDDLDLAIKAAYCAQKTWKNTPAKERAKVLREIAKIILDNLSSFAEIETKEIGKPLKESLFVDVPLAAECFNYYASLLESMEEPAIDTDYGRSLIKYEPYGVCGVYLPYNVPLMIFGFSCAAALAAGNALIIKPSEYGSLSMLELAKHLDDLEIPKGLINIISGKGEKIGKLLAQKDIDFISFTGSRDTLKKITKESSQSPKKVICELGGCNITAVYADADKEAALQNILASSFMKQGQICIGTSIALIEERIYDDFIKDLTIRASKIKVGNPFAPDTGLGALPTKEHLNNVDKRIRDLEKKGAKVLCGGKPSGDKGFFYPATVIEVDQMLYEEFFAPVILVKKVTSQEIEEAVQNNPTGLVLQIWTQDLVKAENLAKICECGTVWINTFAQMTPQTPFGGKKTSGWGRNLGKAGFFEYTQPKHIGIGNTRSPVWGWFGL